MTSASSSLINKNYYNKLHTALKQKEQIFEKACKPVHLKGHSIRALDADDDSIVVVTRRGEVFLFNHDLKPREGWKKPLQLSKDRSRLRTVKISQIAGKNKIVTADIQGRIYLIDKDRNVSRIKSKCRSIASINVVHWDKETYYVVCSDDQPGFSIIDLEGKKERRYAVDYKRVRYACVCRGVIYAVTMEGDLLSTSGLESPINKSNLGRGSLCRISVIPETIGNKEVVENPEFIIRCAEYPAALINSMGGILGHLPKEIDIIYANAVIHRDDQSIPVIAMGGRDGHIYVSTLRSESLRDSSTRYKLDSRIWGLASISQEHREYLIAGTESGYLYKLFSLQSEDVNKKIEEIDRKFTETNTHARDYIEQLIKSKNELFQAHAADVLWAFGKPSMLPMHEKYIKELLANAANAIQSRIPEMIDRVLELDARQLPSLFDALEPPLRPSFGNAIFHYGLSKLGPNVKLDPSVITPLMKSITNYRHKLDSPEKAIGLLAAVENKVLERGQMSKENIQTVLEKLQRLKSQRYDIAWSQSIDYVRWLIFDEKDGTIVVNTLGNGIWRYNYKTGKPSMQKITYPEGSPIAVRRCAIDIDSKTGSLMIGTNTGLVECYTRGNERIISEEIDTVIIECLAKVNNYLVIGWSGVGIKVYSYDGHSIKKNPIDEALKGQLPNKIISYSTKDFDAFIALCDHSVVASFRVCENGILEILWKDDLAKKFGVAISNIKVLGNEFFAVAVDGLVLTRSVRETSTWSKCGKIDSEPFLVSEQFYNHQWWLILGTREGELTAINSKGKKRTAFPRLQHGMTNGLFIDMGNEQWIITVEGGQLRGYHPVDEAYLKECEETVQAVVDGDINSKTVDQSIFSPKSHPNKGQAKHLTDDYIQTIFDSIIEGEKANVIHIRGRAGCGKSVLLADLNALLRTIHWATTYLDLNKAKKITSFSEFLTWIISEMMQTLPGKISGLRGGLDGKRLQDIADFIANANAMRRRSGWRGLVIFIDHMQDLPENIRQNFLEKIIPKIVEVSENVRGVKLITASSLCHGFSVSEKEKIFEINHLNPKESLIFLDYLSQSNLFVSDSLKRRLSLMAGGSLKVLQFLCYQAVVLANEQKVNFLVPSMLNELEKRMYTQLNDYFQNLWNQTTPWGRVILGVFCRRRGENSIDRAWVISIFKLLEYFLTDDLWNEETVRLERQQIIVIERAQNIPVIKRLECGLFASWIDEYISYYHVLYSNLNLLSQPIPTKALLETDHALDHSGTLDQFTEAIRIPQERWSTIIKLSKGWQSCKDLTRDGLVERSATDFLTNFVAFTSSEILKKVQRSNRFLYVMVRLTGTANPIVKTVPLVLVLGNRPVTSSDFGHIRNIVHNLRDFEQANQPVLILMPAEMTLDLTNTGLYTVIIEEKKLQRLLFSENPGKTLAKLVISSGNLVLLDPYNARGAVRDNSMFVGRITVMNKLKDSYGVFFIIGPRKIGKSSVLVQTERAMKRPHYPVINIDCISVHTLEEFFDLINSEIQSTIGFDGGYSSINSLAELERFLLEGNKHGPISLFLDEFDGMIGWDLKYGNNRIAEWLHHVSHNRRLRIALAGWDVLFRKCLDGNHPLFNAGTKWQLRPLSKDSSDRLIQYPFANLFIEIDNEPAILQRIYYQTGGYPALIQCIGSLLIDRLSKTRQTTLKLDDVDAVLRSQRLQLELEQTFFVSFKGLACLVVSRVNQIYQDIDEIKISLDKKCNRDIPLSEIDQTIKLLCCQGAISLSPNGKKYQISNPLLANCLSQKSRNIKFEEEAIKEYQLNHSFA